MDVVTLGAALNGSKKYTDTVAQSLMGGVRYQGEVDYYSDLPSNAEVGDAYTVKYSGTSGTDLDGTEYTWGLNHQTQQYGWIDFSKDSYTKTETNNLLAGKQGVIDSTHKLSADLVDDENSTNKFVTASDKQTWNGKQNAIDSSHKLSSDLVDDTNATNKFVTAAEKTSIGTSAEKLTGIAETADNYIEMGNGIRLYVSDTAPTGTIPEGSLGVGW